MRGVHQVEATATKAAPTTADQALARLTELGAPPDLVRHHELVVEAARELVVGLGRFAQHFNVNDVLVGAALHDAGKILHPAEMTGPGERHEIDGEALLRAQGFGSLARFCVTHSQWSGDGIGIEDLLVALADTLWKGKRSPELEFRVVTRLAQANVQEHWAVYIEIDDLFERVAARGPERLAASAKTG